MTDNSRHRLLRHFLRLTDRLSILRGLGNFVVQTAVKRNGFLPRWVVDVSSKFTRV